MRITDQFATARHHARVWLSNGGYQWAVYSGPRFGAGSRLDGGTARTRVAAVEAATAAIAQCGRYELTI